jgi:PilZ domain-containing protein
MGATLQSRMWRLPVREEETPDAPIAVAEEEELDTAPPPRRRFVGVPTHAVSVVRERRRSPRASLMLPLHLMQVAGRPEPAPLSLVIKDISSSGVFFFSPKPLQPGLAIEMEIGLIERRPGCGNVQMHTAAHVVRAEEAGDYSPGWHGCAASFDDIAFNRDDTVPGRYLAR